MSKYDPLEMHLLCLPENQNEITLSFKQVENIIEDGLPKSAYEHRAWWSNELGGRHANAHVWMDVGWKVDTVDQREYWVHFVRKKTSRLDEQ